MSGKLPALALVALFAGSCQSSPASDRPAPGSGDAAFNTLTEFVLKDHYRRHPSASTDLGIHLYDANMDEASKQAIDDETAMSTSFRQQLEKIDASTLTPPKQLDREQLMHALDAAILENSVIRTYAKDPDFYS